MTAFEITDLGRVSYFLGMEFLYESRGIILHQGKYAREILKRFDMLNCKSAATPAEANLILEADSDGEDVDPTLFKQLVGCLRYLCKTRPDINYLVGVVSRFMSKPKMTHFLAATRILKYISGTIRTGILFPANVKNCDALLGYSDADWCGDKVDRRSTTGFVFLWNKAPISWCSKKQPVVALSSCESEYIAGAVTACQAIWLSSLMTELKITLKKPITLLIDNKSAINLAKNPVLHGRSKHIDTKFHFLREQVEKGNIEVDYCNTQLQIADIMTKGLKTDQFLKLRRDLGIATF